MGSFHERNVNLMGGRGWATDSEARKEKAAKKQKQKDKIYAGAEMPDEDFIRKHARKMAAMRRGSRISTVLTDQETLG